MEQLNQDIMIAEGWVSHHRKNKKDLNFKYDIFNLLIPDSVLIEHQTKFKGFPFLKLQAKDYLEGRSVPLKTAIHDFLARKLEYHCDYIILQTIPKMFGYGFNPISFWYCYKENKLDSVLCEVNNTFNERHFYFVSINNAGEFHTLNKNFHVSPFFDVVGHYDFKFKINKDNNSVIINYFKDADTLLLSTHMDLKKSNLNSKSAVNVLIKYKWMTLMVIVRIHYLAIKLWFKKIPFFKKPQLPIKDVTHE